MCGDGVTVLETQVALSPNDIVLRFCYADQLHYLHHVFTHFPPSVVLVAYTPFLKCLFFMRLLGLSFVCILYR
jgi:hypothetical protein